MIDAMNFRPIQARKRLHLLRLALGTLPLVWLSVCSAAAPTQFVASGGEPIKTPFVRSSALPATLSLDALTPAEIRQIRLDLYAELQQTAPWPVEGIDGCMAWFYVRASARAPWQAVGFAVDGPSGNNAALKLNGSLRPAHFHYRIPTDTERGFYGAKSKPGLGPGRGSARIVVFQPRTSYRELAQQRAADQALGDRLDLDRVEPEARSLSLLGTASLRVQEAKMPCTDLKTSCRRYVSALDQTMVWKALVSGEEQVIARAADAPAELAIEDMCPFSRKGMVDDAMNTRIGGAEPDMKKYGFRRVEPLRVVLKRHADEEARKSAKP